MIDLRLRIKPAYAEANRAAGILISQSQGFENMGRVYLLRVARRAAGDSHITDCGHESFSVHIVETDIQISGQTMFCAAVDAYIGQLSEQAVTKAVPQSGNATAFFRHI